MTISIISCLLIAWSIFCFCPSQDLRQTSLSIASTSIILCSVCLAMRGKCCRRSRWRQGEQQRIMNLCFMSRSSMQMTLELRLTILRLNFASARFPSMNELCSSATSPDVVFTVNLSGERSGLRLAAALAVIICCSLELRCRKRPFLRQFPRIVNRLSAELKHTQQ